jgi:TolB protein
LEPLLLAAGTIKETVMPRLFSRRPIRLVLLAVLALLLAAAPAQAAFPGSNGKIAFTSDRDSTLGEIYTMNPDGSGVTRLTSTATAAEWGPTWSPDGTKIAFTSDRDGNLEIYTMNPDGTGVVRLTSNAAEDEGPSWSPDGTKIAFASSRDGNFEIYTMNADGTGVLRLTSNAAEDVESAWSPDGTKIAFASSREELPSGNFQVYTMNTDGTGVVRLAARLGREPGWSPDGTKIAFVSCCDGYPTLGVYKMNADGSGIMRLTKDERTSRGPSWSPDGTKIAFESCCVGLPQGNSSFELYAVLPDGTLQARFTRHPAEDIQADWQPLPYTAYARPKSATPLRVSLVPAYTPCTTPNRHHGPPLAFDSCSPPAQASSYLTVGTVDANGAAEQSVGTVSVKAIPGDPATPADESDVRIETSITDVRQKAGLADYAGELSTVLRVRLTDRYSGGAQTVQDFPLEVTVPCAATGDTAIGSDCSLITTTDTISPGAVPESKRSVWAIDKVDVFDGGPDAIGSTSAGNTLFVTQGVFVP